MTISNKRNKKSGYKRKETVHSRGREPTSPVRGIFGDENENPEKV